MPQIAFRVEVKVFEMQLENFIFTLQVGKIEGERHSNSHIHSAFNSTLTSRGSKSNSRSVKEAK